MMSVTNVAIVGTGFMGPAHTEGLRRLGINVAGILGSSAEKSQRAAADLGIPKSIQQLCRPPGRRRDRVRPTSPPPTAITSSKQAWPSSPANTSTVKSRSP